jgi:hypothetical protein
MIKIVNGLPERLVEMHEKVTFAKFLSIHKEDIDTLIITPV